MAKKSKGFGELLHQQKRFQAQQQSREKLEQRIQQSLQGKVETVHWNEGEIKTSEVLEAFVKPFLNATKNTEQRKKLLAIAAFAWNITLLPEDQQQAEIDNIVQSIAGSDNPQLEQDTREILAELMERKLAYFASHRRYILDYELKETPNDFFLSVVSTDLDSQEP
ncbi:hypothetical protein [Leptolyngbya sp. FACHB-16]|uniref:hypothetical protein n=1 Tax=unclassified Leptolyngbya TaxID=2650499 RepID=UPI0016851617|nr:hypothetical protein [Leptolyngbya sp. FACHB-16]MBD2156164.1 hypothetical protein [Leptolyngbya sp. FACHB-16]